MARSRIRQARRFRLFITTAVALCGLFLFVLGPALGTSLGGSNFEIDTDANLVVNNAAPSIDWLTGGAGTPLRSDVIRKNDKASGQGDDSLGQGTKEDDPVPTVVDGSIPPNKSDLKVFGALKEKTASGSFLHLFWTRVQDPTGTTNMDFEFNQSQTLSSNGVTPVRTTGDLLIEYHLDNGGTVATLAKREWNGTAWGAETSLSGKAIGSINSSTIPAAGADGVGGNPTGGLDPRTFGEASIDLSAVFTAGRCQSFGSAFLKSRSSDVFTSAVKDFIAPVPVNLTNCGSVLVKKTDFDSGAPLDGAQFSVAPGSTDANGVTAASTPLTAEGNGLYCAENLLFGNHTVTEDAAPPGFDKATPSSQTFNVGDNGTCASRLANGDTPDLTFRDPRQRGAIEITKTAKDAAAGSPQPLAGAVFTINGVTVTTDAAGKACVDNLLFGPYTVHEVSAPSGYATAADQQITVSAKGDCLGGGVRAPASFVDTPLSKITVSFTSLAGPGKTAATIQCTGDSGSAPLPEATPKVLTNLVPGTYSCTVVVDP